MTESYVDHFQCFSQYFCCTKALILLEIQVGIEAHSKNGVVNKFLVCPQCIWNMLFFQEFLLDIKKMFVNSI